ncbi:hypothetical protein [Lactobacillus intestinalis]|uniref:Uncharacterized protein n=1 Tax=Lactobacillus intestinalis DSM 6629 TaxID=1423761 RepID=A0ABR5PR26_9LACO|nr:hypothetical protein [Lactobacillus intestinalis]KRM33685.1 hypothetical protein FC44_GL000819 [Lactobacillus intestinalis DSM 6629]UTW40769.1 hypothetical protein KBW87_02475 [Lactobacillus intestinalis]
MTNHKKTDDIMNLPTDKEHFYWTKDKIVREIDNPEMQKHITYMKNYEINKNTLCVYNFFEDPIKGKYLSCIFDVALGIVFSTQSSAALVESLIRKGIYPSYFAQKEASRRLDFNHFNSIIVGYGLYFTTRGTTTRRFHLLALHHMKDYHMLNSTVSVFTTLAINGFKYEFELDDCHQQLPTLLNHGLYLYKSVHDSLLDHLHAHTHHERLKLSLVNNEDHLIHHDKDINFVATLSDVIEQTFSAWLSRVNYELNICMDWAFLNIKFL